MKRPGGPLSSRPQLFTFILDRSGSMAAQGKMASLNSAVREALPHMRRVAAENPNAVMLIRVVTFSTGAAWSIREPIPVETFRWTDLEVNHGGRSDFGAALKLVAEEFQRPTMPQRSHPPVLAAITDGYHTDDFDNGLAALMAEPWGAKSVRIGIGMGSRAGFDFLERFVGNPAIPVLKARNADDLVRYIRWASTSVVQASSTLRPDRAHIIKEMAGPPVVPESVGVLKTW